MSNTADCAILIDLSKEGAMKELSPIVRKEIISYAEKKEKGERYDGSIQYIETDGGKNRRYVVNNYYKDSPGMIQGTRLIFDVSAFEERFGRIRLKDVGALEIGIKDGCKMFRMDFFTAWDFPNEFFTWLDSLTLAWQYGVSEPGNNVFEIGGDMMGIVENASAYCPKCEDTVIEEGAEEGGRCPICGCPDIFLDKYLDFDGDILNIESDYYRKGEKNG